MEKGRGGSWMLSRTQDNPAISWFDSVSVREGLRLYRIKPRTGKTHQIRVALKSVEPPSSEMSVTAARRRIAVICTLALRLHPGR
jgi:hypothetical protein